MKRVVLYFVNAFIGFLLVAGVLSACYHGNPPWPGPDPTQPTPIFQDPCADPSYTGPCPMPSFSKKSDGGADR